MRKAAINIFKWTSYLLTSLVLLIVIISKDNKTTFLAQDLKQRIEITLPIDNEREAVEHYLLKNYKDQDSIETLLDSNIKFHVEHVEPSPKKLFFLSKSDEILSALGTKDKTHEKKNTLTSQPYWEVVLAETRKSKLMNNEIVGISLKCTGQFYSNGVEKESINKCNILKRFKIRGESREQLLKFSMN
jgi:hypothetical protein